MYNLNINKLGFEAIKPSRRKPKFLAFLYTLLYPFHSLYAEFTAFKSIMDEEIAVTAQVHSMERWLNSLHGLTYVLANRDASIAAGSIIYFEDTSSMPFTWMGNGDEIFMGNGDEVFMAGSDSFNLHNHFIVKVPNSLSYDVNLLRAQINKFNHINRRYTIQNY